MKSENVSVEVAVRDAGGTYQTNTVQGVRASSTAGAASAAARFCAKYFGPSFLDVAHVSGDKWMAIGGGPKWYAWCWATGLIELGSQRPQDRADGAGAIAFASGPMRALQQEIGTLARHGQGKSSGKFLVPGVPEARTPDEAVDALIAWTRDCSRMARKNGLPCVVFGAGHEL
jgi:hypothetical protein